MAIKTVTLPKDDRGNDPNDFRDDPKYLDRLKTQASKPDLSWVNSFMLTEEEADMISDPEWVYPNLIIQGHVIAIPAQPNGGKTTIFQWVAGQIAKDYQVFYVNADISGADAKDMVREARENGYSLLLPDMKSGLSMNDVVEQLERMNAEGGDYSGMVWIFDTLKKMTDVINKSKAKQLFQILRGLSAKGMTVVLLAHTNKYYGDDGKPIYEGTGDLRSDVDELIYLIPVKNEDGSMTVSTDPDKVRGAFEPITFNISPDREVSLSEYVDVATLKKAESQYEQDATVIEAITEAIRAGKCKQTEIVGHCNDACGIGRRTVEKVLMRYLREPKRLWYRQRGFQNNTWLYSLEPL